MGRDLSANTDIDGKAGHDLDPLLIRHLESVEKTEYSERIQVKQFVIKFENRHRNVSFGISLLEPFHQLSSVILIPGYRCGKFSVITYPVKIHFSHS